MEIIIKLDSEAEADKIKTILLALQEQNLTITTVYTGKKTTVKKTFSKPKPLKYFEDVIGIWKDEFSESESSDEIQRRWRKEFWQRS